jgi:hypothetical protein
MISQNLIESRQSKFNELTELTADKILSENTASKVKNRKQNIFQKMMSFRNNFLLNTKTQNNQNNINIKTKSIKDILNLVTNNDDKIKLINYLFLNDINNAKQIILAYSKQNSTIISDTLFSSNSILDMIETQNDIFRIIIQNKANIAFLVNKINLMANEKIPYDPNYIMICSYFLISDEDIDILLKQEINHNKVMDLIIKKETTVSYIYLFYIYSYIYHFNNEQIGQCENILDSLLSILVTKKIVKMIIYYGKYMTY